MNISIYDLTIEITRRCNQQCEHCLRGQAQNINISIDDVNTLFSKIDFISCLTLTGGEPSIAVKSINDIIDCAIKNNVTISNFYIATNGKRITRPFVDVIERLYNFCDENEISRVDISNDKFHEIATETKAFQDLLELEFAGYKWEKSDFNEKSFNRDNQWAYPYYGNAENGVINSGLAKENGLGTKNIEKEEIVVSINDDNTDAHITEGILYLNCKGKILAGCDISFEQQDKKNSPFLICDVNDFSIEKVEQYMKS